MSERINKTAAGNLVNRERNRNGTAGKYEKYSNLDEYCAIREYGPKDSKKGVIFMGSLFHRTKHAGGNFQRIVTDEFGARYTQIDYPKKEFEITKVRQQIIDYIESSGLDEIILTGLSFGEVLAIDIIKSLPPEIRKKIKWNLSIGGVSEYTELVPGQKILVDALSLLGSNTRKKLCGLLGMTDRHGPGPIQGFASNQMYYRSNAERKKLRRHRDVAAMGTTPGLGGRLKYMKEHKVEKGIIDIPIIAAYTTSKNFENGLDDIFRDPIANAEKTISQSSNKERSQIINIPDGRHGGMVEYPERWDDKIREIFSELIGREIQNKE